MKKITFLFVATLLMLSQVVFAGGDKDGFRGTVKYKITIEGRELTPTEQSQFPTDLVFYFLDNMERQDNIRPMGSYSTITNNETYEMTMLLDMMGQKLYTKIDGSKLKAVKDSINNANKDNFKLLDGTKTIAGYTCKKAEVFYGEGENKVTITVYYTEQIPVKHPDFNNIPGFPLYYSQALAGEEDVDIIYQAAEVSTKKPKKKLFKPSSDYSEMTPEMRKQMGLE